MSKMIEGTRSGCSGNEHFVNAKCELDFFFFKVLTCSVVCLQPVTVAFQGSGNSNRSVVLRRKDIRTSEMKCLCLLNSQT